MPARFTWFFEISLISFLIILKFSLDFDVKNLVIFFLLLFLLLFFVAGLTVIFPIILSDEVDLTDFKAISFWVSELLFFEFDLFLLVTTFLFS